jgi:hypothetical protein
VKITYRRPLDDLSVSPFQAKAALQLAGMLDAVESYMSDPATDPIVRLAWQHASEYRRQSPTVLAMAAHFGWSDEQLDQLFVTAKGIVA